MNNQLFSDNDNITREVNIKNERNIYNASIAI